MQISYKNIWLITYPVLLSLMVEQLISMTDTAFLGRLGEGEVELGASALAATYYLTFYVIGSGFGIGAQILLARLNGEKNYQRMNSVFLTSAIFLVILAAVITLLSKTLSPTVLKWSIQSEDIYLATIEYLDWRVYGLFFSFLMVVCRSFLVAIAHTRILTVSSIIMVTVNIICNYALIFGHFGFPKLGIAGAAIGSSFAELTATLFLFIYLKNKASYQKYNLFAVFHFDWKLLKRILNMSVWTMMQSLLALSTWFVFFIMIEHLGKTSLAIANIIRNISSIPFIFTMAFATTGSSLISNLIGAGKQEQVIGLCRKIITMCILFIISIILLACIAPTMVLRIYTDNEALILASIPTLYVMLFVHLISGPAFIMNFAVSGTGNTKAASMLELMTLVIYIIYISYVTGYLKLNITISWTAEYVYGAILFLTSFVYIWKGNWRNKKI